MRICHCCTHPFAPDNPRQRYCGRPCKRRARKLRRLAQKRSIISL